MIKDEGYACRVCVDGVDSARQVLESLGRAFAFKTSEPMREGAQPTQCIFRIPYGAQVSHRKLVSILSAIPGVRLKLEHTCGEFG